MRFKFEVLLLLLLLTPTTASAYAVDIPSVEVSVLSQSGIIRERMFQASVNVKFNDLSLWNEEVTMTYHTYDKEGNVITFENSRYAVPAPDYNGNSAVFLPVHLDNVNSRNFDIIFDLCDQRNLYWLSGLEDMKNLSDFFPPVSIKLEKLEYKSHDLFSYLRDNTSVSVLILACLLLCIAGLFLIFSNRRSEKILISFTKTERYINNLTTLFLSGCFLGALFFIATYGVHILNPTYDDWIKGASDFNTEYTAWRAFRTSEWTLPLGMSDKLLFPFKASVIFYLTPFAPFAVFFKLFSPILPETFQYMGIYGIMCYALMGGIGALIINKLTKLGILSVIPSLFIVASPLILMRMYAHSMLGAQWILLLAFWIFLNTEAPDKWGKRPIEWGLLMLLVPGVHPYWIAFTAIFLSADIIRYLLNSKDKKKYLYATAVFAVSFISCLLSMFVLGAFNNKSTEIINRTLYDYTSTIGQLFNPYGIWYTAFLKDFSPYSEGWYEGGAYIGFGVIVLLIIYVYSFMKSKIGNFETGTFRIKKFIPIVFILLLSLLLSFGSRYTLFGNVFNIPLPGILYKIWGVFNVTGRFIWIPHFLLIFFAIWGISHMNRKRTAIWLMCVCLVLQMVDLYPTIKDLRIRFDKVMTYESALSDPAWDFLAKQNKHIALVADYTYILTNKTAFELADLALSNGATVSGYTISRNKQITEQIVADLQEELTGKTLRSDTFYVFQNNKVIYGSGLYLYNIDGIIVGTIEALPDKYSGITERIE